MLGVSGGGLGYGMCVVRWLWCWDCGGGFPTEGRPTICSGMGIGRVPDLRGRVLRWVGVGRVPRPYLRPELVWLAQWLAVALVDGDVLRKLDVWARGVDAGYMVALSCFVGVASTRW